MPQDPAATLSSLLRASTIDDHDEILKAANTACKANKSDITSQHTRVVALLKLDRFDDALRAISEGGIKLHALCVLEQAYALYKTGKLDEATALLKSAGIQKRSFSHVAAQVAYRAEKFDEARNIYSRLLDDDAGDEENDININIRAALAQAEWVGLSPSAANLRLQDTDGFESMYNAACASIARGALNSASDYLQRALRQCDNADDLSPDEKEDEMRPIMAQQAFVYAKLGKLKEAIDLYKSIGTSFDDDLELKVTIQNNLLALEDEPENPYLLERKFSDFASTGASTKFFDYQSSIIKRNNLVVDLKTHKTPGAASRTEQLLDESEAPSASSSVNIFSVLNAAANGCAIAGKQLVRKLLALANKRPHDVGLVLTIVQIQLQDRHFGAALSILESFLQRLDEVKTTEAQDVRFCPGLVALTVSLMREKGRESCARAELTKAASHWQGRPVGNAGSLLKEAGIELMKSSASQDLELAAALFQKLFDEQQGSSVAAAGLVAALAPSDVSRVEKHLQELPSIESLVGGIDTAQLLSSGVVAPTGTSQSRKRALPTDSLEASGGASKRRRKVRLPKNYVEGTKPDPERWLPLRDRTSYRPKGKKGKKKAAESTQGGIVKDEERLELVGGGGVKVEKAPQPSSKKKKKAKK